MTMPMTMMRTRKRRASAALLAAALFAVWGCKDKSSSTTDTSGATGSSPGAGAENTPAGGGGEPAAGSAASPAVASTPPAPTGTTSGGDSAGGGDFVVANPVPMTLLSPDDYAALRKSLTSAATKGVKLPSDASQGAAAGFDAERIDGAASAVTSGTSALDEVTPALDALFGASGFFSGKTVNLSQVGSSGHQVFDVSSAQGVSDPYAAAEVYAPVPTASLRLAGATVSQYTVNLYTASAATLTLQTSITFSGASGKTVFSLQNHEPPSTAFPKGRDVIINWDGSTSRLAVVTSDLASGQRVVMVSHPSGANTITDGGSSHAAGASLVGGVQLPAGTELFSRVDGAGESLLDLAYAATNLGCSAFAMTTSKLYLTLDYPDVLAQLMEPQPAVSKYLANPIVLSTSGGSPALVPSGSADPSTLAALQGLVSPKLPPEVGRYLGTTTPLLPPATSVTKAVLGVP